MAARFFTARTAVNGRKRRELDPDDIGIESRKRISERAYLDEIGEKSTTREHGGCNPKELIIERPCSECGELMIRQADKHNELRFCLYFNKILMNQGVNL